MNSENKTKSERIGTTSAQTIKLDQKSWEKLSEIINNPPAPTEALKDLMKSTQYFK